MKKINLILSLTFLSALTFTSCDVDIDQPSRVSDWEVLYKNPTDVERGVNLIYSSIPASSEIGFNSIFTDEVGIGKSNGGQGLIGGEYTFRLLSGDDFPRSTWSSYYYMINRINRTIEIAEELKEKNPADEQKYNTSLFELYVLRAYANLKLFSYYTPDYTNMNGYAVIKLDYVPQAGLDEKPPRATVAEIRQFILDDLEKASQYTPRPGASKAYVNVATIDAIKVKLFAMTEEYNLIEPLAMEVANNSIYSLKNFNSPTEFGNKDMHLLYLQYKNEENVADENTDVIFKQRVTLNQGASVAANWYSVRVSDNGNPFYGINRALYNAFDALDPNGTELGVDFARNDIRYYINVLSSSSPAFNYQSLSIKEYENKDILLIGKYLGRESRGYLKADMPLLRTPDLLLCLAEAKAAQGAFMPASTDPNDIVGDYSTVYSIIFNIRVTRLINPAQAVATINIPTITNKAQAYKAILDERRVEFAFEGARYLDLKRIGAKAGLSNGVDRYSKDCEPYGACDLPIGDHRFTLPIPSDEINANPTIKEQQNPGY